MSDTSCQTKIDAIQKLMDEDDKTFFANVGERYVQLVHLVYNIQCVLDAVYDSSNGTVNKDG